MEKETAFWPTQWVDPSCTRECKPRHTGITMVIDKGLGLHAMKDLLHTASSYIDIYKLGFGTSVLYPFSVLEEKLTLALSLDIAIMPGGTFFEIAYTQDGIKTYLERIRDAGFNAVEISDGSMPISTQERHDAISMAREMGFRVFSEYGQKASTFRADQEMLLSTLVGDVNAGADYVIVEARESGNVGIYNKQGEIDSEFVRQVIQQASTLATRLIWEAPQKPQQVGLLKTIGLDANLGNIAPADLLSLETLRRGLRGDTAYQVLEDRRRLVCE
ncbi:phosphosulfolactate synthase [Brevibacillus laterosporus]|uniref:phosphosulfolactate synthase n=1 Tax=Brevibacillus laterosporus TaxID=1465 RepID=UPI00215CD2F2|nr:phosphosulfolactate synthase [Brevibacillus laterosporus]MCR8995081.1 phosphosulfolactate synthase [Brevibacillus laterosporus]